MKIILATDIGFDPDDFVALNLCLANPAIELLGVVADPGYPTQIGLIRSVLKFHGREDIPIGGIRDFAKDENDSITSLHDRTCRHLGVPVSFAVARWEGWELIDALARDNPGTRLVTIGPLLNVNNWVKRGKATVECSYSMGGYVGDPSINQPVTSHEYNFNAGRDGAFALLNTKRIARKVLVSRNVTHHVLYTTELHARVQKIAESSKGHGMIAAIMDDPDQDVNPVKMMHDPLTLLVALDESIVQLQEVTVYSTLSDWGAYPNQGTGTFISIGNGNNVNHQRFESLFLEHGKSSRGK
nr:nucleoside hydrolase [Candidatus Sigynarchaeota archaeon]